MTRKIDIGGRQGRGNPKFGLGEDGTLIDLDITKPAERDLATGAGLLAPDSYSEPETTDLQLGPMTRGERIVKWLLVPLVPLVVCVAAACAVILATN